jgi:hypothetical protein
MKGVHALPIIIMLVLAWTLPLTKAYQFEETLTVADDNYKGFQVPVGDYTFNLTVTYGTCTDTALAFVFANETITIPENTSIAGSPTIAIVFIGRSSTNTSVTISDETPILTEGAPLDLADDGEYVATWNHTTRTFNISDGSASDNYVSPEGYRLVAFQLTAEPTDEATFLINIDSSSATWQITNVMIPLIVSLLPVLVVMKLLERI